MGITIKIILGAAVVCILGILGIRSLLPLNKKMAIKIVKSAAKSVNVIKFSDIASFFKTPERWAVLKSNKHILPIVIKEKEADGTIFVMGCLFDEEKDDVVDFEKNFIVYKSDSIDFELTEYFGNKDMIILQ